MNKSFFIFLTSLTESYKIFFFKLAEHHPVAKKRRTWQCNSSSKTHSELLQRREASTYSLKIFIQYIIYEVINPVNHEAILNACKVKIIHFDKFLDFWDKNAHIAKSTLVSWTFLFANPLEIRSTSPRAEKNMCRLVQSAV